MPTIPADRVKGHAASSPSASSSAPSRLRLAVVRIALTLLLLLLLAYLGNAVWNLLHMSGNGDTTLSAILAAATLPAPVARQVVPLWVEWTSAAAFLLLATLSVVLMRAVGRLRAHRRAAHNKAIDDERSAMIYIAPRASDAAPRPRPTLQRIYDPIAAPDVPASPDPTDALDSTGVAHVHAAAKDVPAPDAAAPFAPAAPAPDPVSLPPSLPIASLEFAPTAQTTPTSTATPASATTAAASTFQPRVFISHSSLDNAFGRRLVADLRQALGSSDVVWYDAAPDPDLDDRGGLAVGDPFPSEIIHQLAAANVFIVVLSPDAVASRWVDFEIAQAISRYLSAGREIAVILPILLRPTNLPELLRIVQYVDLTDPADAGDTPEAADAPDGADQPEGLDWEARYHAAFAEILRQVYSGETRRIAREGEPPFDDTLIPVPDHFVGRAEDLAWALARVQPGAVTAVTALNGLGGIGKTSLAAVVVREVLRERRFPEGIAVVDCRAQTAPSTILRQVLGRFDPRRKPPDEAESDLPHVRDLVRLRLHGKRALVALDNIEPGWPVALAVQPLRAAGLAVLVTSREELPLAVVPVEASRQLQLLAPEDALTLFAQTSGYTSAAALTPSDRAAAERIVAALGYHTLAVKLAAGYTTQQQRPLEAYAVALEADSRWALILQNGQEAVNTVLSTSYAALSAPVQRVFTGLALFATNEMGRQAAQAAATAASVTSAARLEPDSPDDAPDAADGGDSFAAEQALEVLVQRRLLDVALLENLPEDSDRERLRLHPLVRAFAEQQLAAWSNDDRKRVTLAIAAWYANYANDAALPDAARAADERNIEGSLDALMDLPPAAEDANADALIADLCNGMMGYWRDRSRTAARRHYLPAGLEAARRVVTRTGTRDDQLRLARLQNALAQLYQHLGDLPGAEALFAQSLEVRVQLRDRQGEGAVLSNLGQVARQRGQLAAAEDYFQQALIIDREVQDRRGEGVDLSNLGQVARQRGQLAAAEDYYRQGLQALRAAEDARNTAVAAANFAQFLIEHRGKLDEGCQLLGEAISIYHRMGLDEDERETRELAQRLGCNL